MKYLFLSIFVLCLGLVGCNKGPNTGWECPLCGWGCAKNARECISESCTGYECPSCGESQLLVKGFVPPDRKGEVKITKLSDFRYQEQECISCGHKKVIGLHHDRGTGIFDKENPLTTRWKTDDELEARGAVLKRWKPVKR